MTNPANDLIAKWRTDADEIEADGDFCCAQTRRHDADDLELRLCNCADPENCRETVPGYVCRKGAAAPVPCAAAPADLWQPIETCPPDADFIMAAWRCLGAESGFDVGEVERADRGGPWRNFYGICEPSHWMPLPSPPRATGEGEPHKDCPTCHGTGECANAQFRCHCRWHRIGCALVAGAGDCDCRGATGEGARDEPPPRELVEALCGPAPAVDQPTDGDVGVQRVIDVYRGAKTVSTQPFDPHNNAVPFDKAGYAPQAQADAPPVAVALETQTQIEPRECYAHICGGLGHLACPACRQEQEQTNGTADVEMPALRETDRHLHTHGLGSAHDRTADERGESAADLATDGADHHDAEQVAVSLDPHRLSEVTERLHDFLAKWVHGGRLQTFDDRERFRAEARTELARLRGEAAVRVMLDAAMSNDLAMRLGEIARAAGSPQRTDVGDDIDRGLILTRLLREQGFGLVKLADPASLEDQPR